MVHNLKLRLSKMFCSTKNTGDMTDFAVHTHIRDLIKVRSWDFRFWPIVNNEERKLKFNVRTTPPTKGIFFLCHLNLMYTIQFFINFNIALLNRLYGLLICIGNPYGLATTFDFLPLNLSRGALLPKGGSSSSCYCCCTSFSTLEGKMGRSQNRWILRVNF